MLVLNGIYCDEIIDYWISCHRIERIRTKRTKQQQKSYFYKTFCLLKHVQINSETILSQMDYTLKLEQKIHWKLLRNNKKINENLWKLNWVRLQKISQ